MNPENVLEVLSNSYLRESHPYSYPVEEAKDIYVESLSFLLPDHPELWPITTFAVPLRTFLSLFEGRMIQSHCCQTLHKHYWLKVCLPSKYWGWERWVIIA